MTRSFTCFLFFLFFTYHVNAQQTTAEQRDEVNRTEALNKAEYIKKLQGDLFSLPYDLDYINETLLTEIVEKRLELAPHYPDLLTLERDQLIIDQAFADWVINYPLEYKNYQSYLNEFIAQHSSN